MQFDRFLLPSTTVRQSICVQNASVGGLGAPLKDCMGAAFEPVYDPVDRALVFRPKAPLSPHARYNVTVLSPVRHDSGIRATDQAPLENDFSFAFWTGDASQPAGPFRPPVDFCVGARGVTGPAPSQSDAAPAGSAATPLALFRGCASGASCHGTVAVEDSPPYGSALLRLRTLEGSAADLDSDLTSTLHSIIVESRVARETATALDSNTAQRSTNSVFGQNMPYVDSANAGNSYVLYKLIIGMSEESRVARAPEEVDAAGKTSPVVDPWIPDEVWQPAAVGEYDRLRQVVRGEPMPRGYALKWWEAELVSAWIASGAKLDGCAVVVAPRE